MRKSVAIAMAVVTASVVSLLVVAQPVGPVGISRVAHGSDMAGSGTSTSNLSLRLDCAGSAVLRFNGAGWACGSAGLGTVMSVGSGSGISGGPITTTGNLSIDPTYTQRRLTSTCTAPNSILSVAQDGTVVCTTGSVTGTGTANTFTMFTAGSAVGNAPVLVSGGTTMQFWPANNRQFFGSNGDVTLNVDGGSNQIKGASTFWGSLTGSGNTTFTPGAGQSVIIAADATNARSLTVSNNAQTAQYGITFPGGNVSRYRYLTGGVDAWQSDTSGNMTFYNGVNLGDAAADPIAFVGSASTTLDMNGHKILDLTTPTNGSDAANKFYVDAQFAAAGTITGTGTTNHSVRWTATAVQANGAATDDGTNMSTAGTFIFGSSGNQSQLGSGNAVIGGGSNGATTTIGGLGVGAINIGSATNSVAVAAPSVFLNTVALKVANTVVGGTGTPATGVGSAHDGVWMHVADSTQATGFTYYWPDSTHLRLQETSLTGGTSHDAIQWTFGSPDTYFLGNAQYGTSGSFNTNTTGDASLHTVTTSTWGQFNGGIYTDAASAGIFIQNNIIGFQYGVNGPATGYIGAQGYQQGTTQPRDTELDDGQGSSAGTWSAGPSGSGMRSGHWIERSTGSNRIMHYYNQPDGAEGSYDGVHIEGADEWVYQGGLTGGPTPIGHGYMMSTSGTASTTQAPTVSNAGRPGILGLSCGTSNGALVGVVSSPTAVTFDDGNWSFRAIVEEDTDASPLTSGASVYFTIVGFIDTLSGNQTDGCYFEYDRSNQMTNAANPGNAKNWECVCSANSVRTVYLMAGTGSGSAGDGSFTLGSAAASAPSPFWADLEVDVTSTTKAEFYYNGTKMCEIRTHIPSGTSRPTGFGMVQQQAASTGTTTTLKVDYTKWAVDLSSVRIP